MTHIPQIPRQGEPWTTPPAPVPPRPAREPVFALPGAVVLMVVLLGAIHLGRTWLTGAQDFLLTLWLAFIPARYTLEGLPLPGGVGADVWTFVSYALLHGSWLHLITNTVWLVAFGSAVARRFGAARFWALSAAAAAGGAAVHFAAHPTDVAPVVGASAAIAGMMAAAARFVFDVGGPLGRRGRDDPSLFLRPARSLRQTLMNRTALVFIAVFVAMNLAVAVGGGLTAGQAVAWEAHLGGFLIGLLGFRFFDPVPR